MCRNSLLGLVEVDRSVRDSHHKGETLIGGEIVLVAVDPQKENHEGPTSALVTIDKGMVADKRLQ